MKEMSDELSKLSFIHSLIHSLYFINERPVVVACSHVDSTSVHLRASFIGRSLLVNGKHLLNVPPTLMILTLTGRPKQQRFTFDQH